MTTRTNAEGTDNVPVSNVGSKSFLVILSTMLGVILSTFVILGFLGRYFWVDRTEYTKDTMDVQKTLVEVRTTMSQQATALERQEKAFDGLASLVRSVEQSLPRRR